MDSVRSEERLLLYPTPCRSSHWQTQKFNGNLSKKDISYVTKTNVQACKKIYKSSVCVTSNSESLSGQLDEVAKLDKSGLFGACCLYKPPPELAQFLSPTFQNYSFPLTFTYVSASAKGECCFVFVAEFQNFTTQPHHTFRLSALCPASAQWYRCVIFQCSLGVGLHCH